MSNSGNRGRQPQGVRRGALDVVCIVRARTRFRDVFKHASVTGELRLLRVPRQLLLGFSVGSILNQGDLSMSNQNQNPGQQNQTPGQKPGQQQGGGQKPGQQQQDPGRQGQAPGQKSGN